jgi:L-fuculose-phosphate aldolase
VYPESIAPGAVKTEAQHRHDICAVGRWIHDRGYVASTDGNISIRLGPERILTSPTCMSKGMMTPEDLVVTDLSGRRLDGSRNASSELAMHLLIYRLRPDINAVCHAHPPTATGYAAAGMPLDKPILCELVVGLGEIPVARYGTPGTPELTDALEPLVRDHIALLMANHGVVTYGPDLLTAFLRMETVEHFAQVALVTERLGRQNVLSHDDIEKLVVARARYAAGAKFSAPVSAGAQPSPAASPAGERPAAERAPAENDVSRECSTERITLTRRELDALIDEAIQKDRARR